MHLHLKPAIYQGIELAKTWPASILTPVLKGEQQTGAVLTRFSDQLVAQ